MKDNAKTRKNIAKPGYKAVHQIPVGNAVRAKFKSLPHSGTLAGTPNPKILSCRVQVLNLPHLMLIRQVKE